tara:strand:- start:70 stop:831 length:762 start_codon:yes stop_codon:yes gene_type:complete
MKKAIIAASLMTALSANVQADTLLGLYIGGQVWANEAKGSFGEGDLDQAVFDFDVQNQGSYFVAFEHPIPLIPNIKLASTTLDTVGGTQISSDFTFQGETYTASTALDTTFDTSYIDYTLYYELFDNDLLTFDFGVTVRDLDADIEMAGESLGGVTSSNLSASVVLPMLYVNTIIGLPLTGFSVFAQANASSYDGSSIYDYQVGVSYAVLDNLAVDLDINAGYRASKIELDDIDDLYTDLTFEGFFAGATVHF